MEKGASLFASHLSVGIAEDEANGGEEVTFSRAIAPNNHIMFRREGLDHSLVLVAVTDEQLKSFVDNGRTF